MCMCILPAHGDIVNEGGNEIYNNCNWEVTRSNVIKHATLKSVLRSRVEPTVHKFLRAN